MLAHLYLKTVILRYPFLLSITSSRWQPQENISMQVRREKTELNLMFSNLKTTSHLYAFIFQLTLTEISQCAMLRVQNQMHLKVEIPCKV